MCIITFSLQMNNVRLKVALRCNLPEVSQISCDEAVLCYSLSDSKISCIPSIMPCPEVMI